MTGIEILARVNFLLDDELDSLEALAELNLGIADMSLEAPFEDTVALNLALGSRSVVIPSNCMGIQSVYIEEVEIGATYSPFSIDPLSTGTPSKYYAVGSNLQLFPLADKAYTVSLLMLSSYAPMTVIGDTPSIPSQFHMGLVYWIVYHYKSMDEEYNAAAGYEQKYLRYRVALKTYQDNRSAYWTTREV